MNTTQLAALRLTLERDDGQPSELRETHISWVILTPTRAYKIKKPLKLSFLDFSDRAQRLYFCRRELELNRRLAPQIYLDVTDVKQEDNCVTLGGAGEIIDHALVMQRMDDSLLLNKVLPRMQAADVETLARQIAEFHRGAQRIFKPDPGERMNRAIDNILQVRGTIELELGAAAGNIVDDCSSYGRKFVAANRDYIEERSARGFIRDCHGDLHCGNIIMDRPPIIFDCIEFNDEYRQIDVLSEIAFLTMDLEAQGRADLAAAFEREYLRRSGMPHGRQEQRLTTYFKLYRANVRAKVAAIGLGEKAEEEDEPRQESIKQLRSRLGTYLQLVEKYRIELEAG